MAGPGDAEAVKVYNVGAEHFKKGQFEKAAECFKKAAELDGNLYRAWAYLGMAYAQTGQLDPAIEAYRKCIDIAPDYHKAFNNVGELYRRKGQLDYAAMVFKMAFCTGWSNASYDARSASMCLAKASIAMCLPEQLL